MAQSDTDSVTTITVNQRTLERFNQLKRELNVNEPSAPEHNADSFLHALMDTWEAADDEKDTPVDLSEDIAADVKEIIAEQLEPVEQNAGVSTTPGVDAEAIVEEIEGRIDDLEAELPRKVAREVQG